MRWRHLNGFEQAGLVALCLCAAADLAILACCAWILATWKY